MVKRLTISMPESSMFCLDAFAKEMGLSRSAAIIFMMDMVLTQRKFHPNSKKTIKKGI